MTIRTILISILIALSFIIGGYSAFLAYEAIVKRASYVHAQEVEHTLVDLLKLSQILSDERAATDLALNAPNKASETTLTALNSLRSQSNQLLDNILSKTNNIDFKGKEPLTNFIIKSYEALKKIRTEVDKNITKPQIFRSNKITRSWFRTISTAISNSQNLRFGLTKAVSKDDAELGAAGETLHFIWMLEEYSKREQSAVRKLLEKNKPINETDSQNIVQYISTTEVAWDLISKQVTSLGMDLKDNYEAVEYAYFAEYKPKIKKILKAGTNGNDYPITLAAFDTLVVSTNQVIEALKQNTISEINTYTNKLIQQSTIVLIIEFIIGIISFAIAIFGAWTVVNKVVKPISELTHSMHDLAEGKLDIIIPEGHSGNEIGEMADALLSFKEGEIKRRELEATQNKEKQKQIERSNTVQQLIKTFDNDITSFISSLQNSASNFKETSTTLSDSALSGAEGAKDLSSSSQVVNESIHSIASASEELTSSFAEVASQVTSSTNLINDISKQTTEADALANSLATASNKVKDVVELISKIADQTNLLALNANIEAERAGEAGKGFAVVANEVKELASQTNDSVEEITHVIDKMQEVSKEIVQSLHVIKSSVDDAQESSGCIASAVEQQNATTKEISRNIAESAKKTSDISALIDDFAASSEQTGTASGQMLSSSDMILQQSQDLDTKVHKFFDDVKKA